LDEEDLCFYQKATGVEDRDALATHISAFQRDASEVTNRRYSRPVLARLPGYDKVLKIGRSRKNPVFLHVGSGLGVDVHKAVVNGYPLHSIISVDRREAMSAISHKLFRGASAETAQSIPFLLGDPLDPYFLEAVWPFYTQPYAPPPALPTLKSLNPLHGQVSVISACFVFDELSAPQQLQLARGLAGLLSAESGSMIIGVNRPQSELGRRQMNDTAGAVYDSQECWSDLWDGQLFQKGTVKVETRLRADHQSTVSHGAWFMEWTVTRL
ncbi:hypothetical protein K466DRAFT_453461, partial [Polyporus arcularius HHB13444]